jgi:hypothetical protein
MKRHNYQIEIERLVSMGVLGAADSQTECVTLAHRTKRGRADFDSMALSERIARRLRSRIIIVAHDDKCRATRGRRCDCDPDIICDRTGEVLNRRELAIAE